MDVELIAGVTIGLLLPFVTFGATGWVVWRICRWLWRVARKFGYSGAYGLLLLIPVANVLLAAYAFHQWDLKRKTTPQEERTNQEENFSAPDS